MFAVISDIHSNIEALTAVLSEIDSMGIQDIISLGDVVGYNADPDSCVEQVGSRVQLAIRGNHDKAVGGTSDLANFNDVAKRAVLWTRESMQPVNRDRLAGIEAGPRVFGRCFVLCHGSLLDEDQYIFHYGTAEKNFIYMKNRFPKVSVCFFGHTHVPLILNDAGMVLNKRQKARTVCEIPLCSSNRYLINPGSVGQPRDGVPLSAFGVFDEQRFRYVQYRVPYDMSLTKKKIVQAGLPFFLADRLDKGR